MSPVPAFHLCQNGTHRERHPSSLLRTADPSTSSHSQGPASGQSAPLDHGSSDHRPGPSRPTTNGRQPRTTTPAAQPLRLQATERQFQRSDELVDALSVLAPRSEFIGRFSIVADPAVSNIMRARMFADHLRAKALPISYATSPFFFPSQLTLTFIYLFCWGSRENAAPLRFDPSKNSCALLIPCTCQEACIGRFIVTVDDDTSHPCGVPGQRIGAILLHQKSLIQNLPL